MWDLIGFVSIYTFIIPTFYSFYIKEIRDINSQSYVLQACPEKCVKYFETEEVPHKKSHFRSIYPHTLQCSR